MNQQNNRAVFIDKDGTLIPDIPYNVNADLITIDKATIKGLQLIKELGFLILIISNQPGIAKGYFKENALQKVKLRIRELLLPHGVSIDGFYYCPHHADGIVKKFSFACNCRKPEPGLVVKAANDFKVDPRRSWMIGDILNDVEAGNRAGCKTILIDNGNETEWILNSERTPDFTTKDIAEAASVIQLQSKRTIHYHG